MEGRAAAALLVTVGALALGGCSSGPGQDENEESGTYRVDVVDATFPLDQKLAKRSKLEIVVRNAGTSTVPNVAVTVRGFDFRTTQKGVADPTRPQFVINGQPKELGGFPESKEAGPEGGETAYNGTWALGPLKAGAEKTFKWSVTAVKPGPFRLRYEIAAGLDGKAKAVDEAGTRPGGLFVGTVDGKPPITRVDERDGRTIIKGTR